MRSGSRPAPVKTLSKLDPQSVETDETFTVGQGPSGVAVSQGAVWVANSRDGTVSRIDPKSGEPTAIWSASRRRAAWSSPTAPSGRARAMPHSELYCTGPYDQRAERRRGEAPRMALVHGRRRRNGGSVATVGLAGPASTRLHRSWRHASDQQDPGCRLRRPGDCIRDPDRGCSSSQPARSSTAIRTSRRPKVRSRPRSGQGFPKISADGKTQTIQLKRTFRFHTGQPSRLPTSSPRLTATPTQSCSRSATTYLHEIVGADAVIAGNAQTITGVRAPGRYTLQIRTTRPLTDLVSRLTMPFFCPIAINTPLEEIDDPLGSGPYYVPSRVPNRQTVLARNPFYRGSRPASVDQIVLTINGLEACRDAVERNELDYCAVPGSPRRAIERSLRSTASTRMAGSSSSTRRLQ